MSAAAQRAALAAIGSDLVAVSGGSGERRATALLRRVGGRSDGAATFDDLRDVPDWLRFPAPKQRRLAMRVALLWMGDALLTSIDGTWLGRLAEVAGEDILDWAIDTAPDLPNLAVEPLAPEELEAHGFALLRSRLPAPLHAYLAWHAAPSEVASPDGAVAAFLAAALRAEAAA